MIKIVLYKNTLKLFFNGENFTEIVTECKNFGLKFTEEDNFKFYTGKPNSFHSLIPELKKYEDITFMPDEKTIIDFCKPQLQVTYSRAKVNDDLLKFKPVKGKAPFENYQYDAIQKGIETNRKLFDLPLGSGKSYILSNIVNHLVHDNKIDKVLIILPNHLKGTIKREVIKFYKDDSLTDNDFYIVSPENRLPFESDCKFVIMSYKNLVMISDDIYKLTTGKKSTKYRNNYLPIAEWGNNRLLILDEIHSIKNNTARQTKAVHQVKEYFAYRYGFSGTISPNNVAELYSSITLLDDNLIPMEYNCWLKTIANLGNRFSMYAINYFYDDKVKKFINSMKPYIMSLKAEEILDLPDYINDKIYVDLSAKQLAIYRGLISYTLNVIKEEKGEITTKEIVNKFAYLSLALDNPSILKGKIDKEKNPILHNMIEKWNITKDYNKLFIIDDLLEQYIKDEKRKVIIWCFHPVTIEELSDYYKNYNPLILHGGLKVKDITLHKEQTVDLFKKSKEHNLLIVNPLVLSSGVTITEATRQIFVDRSANYQEYLQSSRRIYRIGSKEKVITHNLIYSNSLDERVDSALERKDDLNKNLMKNEYLSKEQIRNLFEGEID